MINLIEVKNFRSLKYISQKLNGFNVLVGANATGKTTFMDLIKFVADIVDNGIEKAVFERVSNFDELTFGKQGGDIEFAIELKLPESKVRELRNSEKKNK
jgi:predicted ATPase